MSDRHNQNNGADDVELSVIGQIPTPQHAHILHREESVDVKDVTPPVLRAVDVIEGWRLEDGVAGKIFHRDFDDAENVEVRRCQADETVSNKASKVQSSGSEFIHALRELFELSLGICSEVDERHQEPADEEESVDAESSICDGLEEELLLDDFSQFGVVGILEGDDASVTKNDPSH